MTRSALAARLAAPVLLFLLAVAFHWKLVLTNQYTWLAGEDITNQVLPWFQFQAGEWQQGRFPLWDPYHWAGQPLIGQAQPGAVYPFNWLLFLAPTSKGWIGQSTLHWYYVLIHYMGALFCYWFCRDLGRSRGAAVTAAAVFGFGGFLGNIDWPQMLNGAIWAPLVFLFLFRLLRGDRPLASAALCGFFVGVCFLSGHHQIPIFIAMSVALVIVFHTASGANRSARWPIGGIALGGVLLLIAVLTAAAQMLPAIEYSNLAYRWVGMPDPLPATERVPYSIHTQFSMGPIGLLGLVIPSMFRHSNPYVGFAVIGLALVGLSAAWRQYSVRWLSAIGLGSLLYALGSDVVWSGFLYSVVPGLDKARNVSMALVFLHTVVCAILSYSIDNINTVKNCKYTQYYSIASVAFGIFAAGLVYAVAIIQHGKMSSDIRVLVTSLVAVLSAAAIRGRLNGHLSSRFLTVSLCGLFLIDQGNGNISLLPHRNEKERTANLRSMAALGDIADFLHRQVGPFRITTDRDLLRFNFGDWHGIEQLDGYLASISRDVFDAGPWVDSTRKLFGVRYHVAPKPDGGWSEQVYESPSGYRVYQNPNAFPLAWLVHRAGKLDSKVEVWRAIANEEKSLRSVALLPVEVPDLESCGGKETVAITRRLPMQTVLRVDARCRAMLILADTFYPGWEALIDGRPAKIFPAYSALRGVVVESGSHTVEFRYRPRSVYWGAAFSLFGAVLAFVCCAVSPRASRMASISTSFPQ